MRTQVVGCCVRQFEDCFTGHRLLPEFLGANLGLPDEVLCAHVNETHNSLGAQRVSEFHAICAVATGQPSHGGVRDSVSEGRLQQWEKFNSKKT